MSKRAEIHIRNLVFPAMLLMVGIGASAETLTGRVVGVADGDTITVLDANREQHKIRLGGIDAPEKAQPFGQRSKESLSTMVFGKDVDVQWDKAESELIGLHMGLGAWIRNNLGLWSGNRSLLESTGAPNADDASMVIVEAVWERLREMVPKVH